MHLGHLVLLVELVLGHLGQLCWKMVTKRKIKDHMIGNKNGGRITDVIDDVEQVQ